MINKINLKYIILTVFFFAFSNFSIIFSIRFTNNFSEEIKVKIILQKDCSRCIKQKKSNDNTIPFLIIKSGESEDFDTGFTRSQRMKKDFMETFGKFIFEKNGEAIELTSEQFFNSLKNQDIFIFMRPYLLEFPFYEDSWFSKF